MLELYEISSSPIFFKVTLYFICSHLFLFGQMQFTIEHLSYLTSHFMGHFIKKAFLQKCKKAFKYD